MSSDPLSLDRPSRRRGAPAERALLLVPLAGLSLAACGSGAHTSVTGGDSGLGGPGQFLNVDFQLRRDFFLAGHDEHDGFLGDLAAADLDADGDVDLVQTNFADHTVTVALGTGFGQFPIVETYPAAGAPLRAVVGDFDGDGDADVALAVTSREFDVDVGDPVNGVQVLLQDEDGFGESIVRELGAEPFDLAAAPVGAGGADELVVTVPDEQRTRWFRVAAGELELVQDMTSFVDGAFGTPLEVAVADVDGDGAADVLVSEHEVEGGLPDRVVLHRNLPDQEGGLLLPSGSGIGGGESLLSELALQTPFLQALGDVDGDGRDDVAVSEFEGTRVVVLGMNASDQVQLREVDFGAGVLSVAAEDLNGDGFADLAAALWGQGSVGVAYAGAPGQFSGVSRTLSVGYFPRAVHAVDLDAADPSSAGVDLMTCNSQDLAYLKAQSGGFKSAHGYRANVGGGPIEPAAVRAADLDGDGDQDVVAIDAHQREIVFLEGDGSGALAFAGAVQLSAAGDEAPGYLLVRDLDGDGDLDVAASIAQRSEIALLRNDGALPFTVTSRVGVGSAPRGVDAADFDGDGDLDLVVSNHGDSTVQLCLGDGAGSFVPQLPVPVQAPPLAIEAYDVDGDGDEDCVVSTGIGGPQESFLLVLEGSGDGGLGEVAAYPMSAQAHVLFCGDLDDTDGDELCDVVASQVGEITQEIVVFRNRSTPGAIAFAAEPLMVGLNPGTLEVSDVDRDGDLDLVVLLGRGELVVARNEGSGQFPAGDYLPARDPVLDQGSDLRGWSAPFGTVASALADLDGDELEELILVSPRTPHVWVARNQSTVPVDE